MLFIHLHDTKHNQQIPMGTVGEFIKTVTQEMRAAKITSKLFSRQADPEKLDKEFAFALDRIIQKIRDENS